MKAVDPSSPSPLPSTSSVTFIPAMMDGACGTSPTIQRMSSMQIMMMDMKVMAQNMKCIPEMIGSMMNREMMTGMLSSWMNMRDMCLQMMLWVIEMCMMVMVIPCFLAMPGVAFMCMCCMCACAIMMLCWPMNGERVMRCEARGSKERPERQREECADERWVYINGAMTRYAIPQTL
jgi:hypothetical protein